MTSSPTNRDSLFAAPLGNTSRFKFNQSVVDVFPDMLRRSIPGYESIITQSGLLAARYAQANTRLYDLGCSLGATALALRAALSSDPRNSGAQSELQNVEIHAIDNAAAMISACHKVIELDNTNNSTAIPVYLHEADLEHCDMQNASVVAMNFTLQFVAPAARDVLLARIANALVPGGVLILSEKVCFDDPVVNDMHIEMYHAFKSANGYSNLEISQKRTALENVLIPDTLDTHRRRLHAAGFEHASVWFQCFNFASLIAIKPLTGSDTVA